MTTPALTDCVVPVLRSAQACLMAELPAVLAILAAGFPDLTLPAPVSYWRSEGIPSDWDSPGVGIFDVGSEFIEADALSAFQVSHDITARIIIDAEQSSADDLSAYDDGLRLYSWAVCYSLQRYLADPAYAGAVGVWRCVPISSTPAPYPELYERSQFLRFVDISIQVDQRQRRLIP